MATVLDSEVLSALPVSVLLLMISRGFSGKQSLRQVLRAPQGSESEGEGKQDRCLVAQEACSESCGSGLSNEGRKGKKVCLWTRIPCPSGLCHQPPAAASEEATHHMWRLGSSLLSGRGGLSGQALELL